jgi:hypothetical protein
MEKEIFKNSTLLKAKILSYGFRISRDAELMINANVKEEHRGYGDSNWGEQKETQKIPAEIMLPGDIVTATHIRPESPLCLELINSKLVITERDKKISDVYFLKRPNIWSYSTKSGINMKKIANFYGRDCLNFNIYSGCEFWEEGLPCKFCSVKPTQIRYKEVKIKKSPREIRETAKLAFEIEEKIDFVLVTGGSYLDGDEEIKMVIPVLKNIQEVIPKSWNGVIKGNVAMMIPRTVEKIDKLMETGIEHPSFNLEVWGEEYFNFICPGKAKYRGWHNILETYRYGVSRYGRGKFWVNFVAGLNDLETLKNGFTYMAKMGVVPGANVFHPDVGSFLGDKKKSPSPEYIIELYKHAASLYHRYDFLPFFNEKCLRNSLANEAFLGYV